MAGVSWAQSVETIDRLRSEGERYDLQGDATKALSKYLEAYRLACRIDVVRAANLTVDIGSIYYGRNDARQGATYCQTGLKLLQKATIPPDSVRFKLYSSLGEMYKKLNEQDSCYLYFSQANSLLQKHPELENRIPVYVIYHYNNQGMMYIRAGSYTEGLSYLTRALQVTERQKTTGKDIAILRNNLGEIYEQLSQFEKAFALRKSADQLHVEIDLDKVLICSGAAWDALQCKKYEEAFFFAQKTLTLYQVVIKKHPEQQNPYIEVLTINQLGDYYSFTNQGDKATAYYDRALKRHTSQLGRRGKLIAYSWLGKAYIEEKQHHIDKAIYYSQQALIASHQTFNSTDYSANPAPASALSEQSLFESLSLKARLFRQQFDVSKKITDLHTSLSTYSQALAVADAMRRSYNLMDTKWFFTTQVRPAYVQAFETAYLLYEKTRKAADLEQAFNLLERSKAAVLSDVTRELLVKPANIPADLLARERELQRKITRLKLETTQTSPVSELTDAEIQLAQLQQRLEKEFPAYYRAKYRPEIISLAKVQATLPDQTAYLSYLVGNGGLYTAVVTSDQLTILRRADARGNLKKAVTTLIPELYTNPGFGNYKGTPAAIESYRWLIEPVKAQLGANKRLVISRDGQLHHLPFEALETGSVVNDFLIRHYAITYVASATTLLNPTGKTADEDENLLLSIAPFIRPISSKRALLPYLPASQDEVEGLPGDKLLGNIATKRRFLRSYANYELLHLATHAQANDEEPNLSYIAFYPDGNPDKLYAGEIYNLLLPRTRLVTLSACETGKGQLHEGEGVMSLAQAFAYAGCPSILSTLWNAHDESIAYLSQHLYTHMQAGEPLDVALQRARLEYFDSKLYKKLDHPHYWANLTLIGNNQPVYPSSFLTMIRLITIALLAGVVVGGVFLFRQRRNRARGANRQ